MKRKRLSVRAGLRIGVLFVVLLLTVLLCSCASKAEEHSGTGLETAAYDDGVPPYFDEQEETEQQTIPPVQVVTSEYELTYSGELADVLLYREQPDSGSMEFSVKLGNEEVKVFIMHFDSMSGEYVEMIPDAHGNKIPVTFEMMELPKDLSEEEEQLFYCCQDAVNEIVASLKVK